MTISARSPIAASASRAPATRLWRCISRSKKRSSRGQTCSRVTGLPAASRSAPEKAGASSANTSLCSSATHSAKCGAKWSSTSSQSLISSGLLMLRAPPAPPPAAPGRFRALPRRRSDRARGLRGSEARRRGSRDLPIARAFRPGSGRSGRPAAPRAYRRSASSRALPAPALPRHLSRRASSLSEGPVGQKILVVEDNELNLKLFCDLLRAHGYEAEAVRDGREALERARAFAPDLVVMDIQMPHISGLELIEQMKADEELRRTPIMAVTAYAARGDEERIRDAGAEGYVSKPISVIRFVEAVRLLIEEAAAREEESPAEEPSPA